MSNDISRKTFLGTLIAGLLATLAAKFSWARASASPNVLYIKSGNYLINLVLTEEKFLKMMQDVPDGYACSCVIECADAVDMNLINGWHAMNCLWWSKKSDMAIAGGNINMGYCAVFPWRTGPLQSRDMMKSKPGVFKGLPEGAGYLEVG